jgi:pimeloyl-ACP methyl ester carboxylesterase
VKGCSVSIARSNGYKIHYEVCGAGPVLVLHPGMYEVGTSWTLKGYTPALRDEYTVVEVDPLAHEGSDAPRDADAYALERRVDDVLAVLDDLGAMKASFRGYSMGAWIGYGIAKYAPDRCTSLVAGAWDPVGGIETAYADAVTRLGMPANSDWVEILRQMAHARPEQTAVIDAGNRQAFRLCHEGFENRAGLDTGSF